MDSSPLLARVPMRHKPYTALLAASCVLALFGAVGYLSSPGNLQSVGGIATRTTTQPRVAVRFAGPSFAMRPGLKGAPKREPRQTARRSFAPAAEVEMKSMSVDQMISKSKNDRISHLEEQAMEALKYAIETREHPVFPCAMIAGDMVILDLLNRLGFVSTGKVQVMFVDTFHLFDETITFMKDTEARYGFKGNWFHAEGCEDKAAYDAKHGADLWKVNIEEYDRICKVEPFQRGLKTLQTDCMINGRRRDHGFERAFIDVYEDGKMAKVNPLAYWTFEDCWDYINKYKIAYHPLHDQGYPSIGDAKDTVPVPKEKWFEYAGERSGRFTGLKNKDGSTKTECGIHVDGAERTFERDLFIEGKVKKAGLADVEGMKNTILTVYAPWCQFSQNMEEEFTKLAEDSSLGVSVTAVRGDEEREVARALGVEAFPTTFVINGDGKRTKYPSEERTVDAWKSFIAANS
mmetsp:Transcript_23416/g.41420  ORF Transcript_23416/g.41420 Transcript_23416/m.41420 type:complete len:462 (-) Transcript_23416:123-1508(-)